MRNKNGVTMISLVIYVFAFTIIIGIVGAVTTFFSNNVSGLNESAGKNAEYNKFNVYMSEYTKNGYQVTIGDYGENSNPYIAFEKEEEQVVFEKIDDVLYMDSSKLCDKVEEFEAVLSTTENGQEVLKTKIKINGTVFTNDYVLEFSQVADEEEPIDNSNSLILGFVDDLGTLSTIYLYNNIDKVTSGTITVTMPNNTTKNITALADTSTISNTANYATYTVSKNGIYEFKATNGTSTTTTKIKVKNIEKFTDISTLGLSYASSEQNAYNYNGAAIPKGYYVDTKSKVGTGLVITDAIDGEGYSTGNEWVWVPVNSQVKNDDFYREGSGVMAGTNVNYTKYSKLWKFTINSSSGVSSRTDLSNPQVQPSTNSGYREPAILIDGTYGEVANLGSINKRATNTPFTADDGVDAVATQYVTEFNNMVESVVKYNGFFIGRYEIRSNGEKPGAPLSNKTWYEYYNHCMNFGKDNTVTGMIYGTMWDATVQWFTKSNSERVNYFIDYGVYKANEISVSNNDTKIIVRAKNKGSAIKSGQTSFSRFNNIYDLAGNYEESSQEAFSASGTAARLIRGGGCGATPAMGVAYRAYDTPTNHVGWRGSRAYMYIKTNKNSQAQIDNSQSLITALVDDLGTRSTIYIYNNKNKITSGTITVTMPNGTTQKITALADTSNISDTANYATYTVSQNGTYRFQATDGTNTSTTTVEVKNIEKFTDVSLLGLSYYNNENKAYNYNGAAVPVGYYIDTKSDINTGLVITDAVDNNGYSIGNEWVWVPVNETVGNADFYLTGSGTVYGTNVQYTKYSKLWQFTTDPSTGVNTRTNLSNPQEQPSAWTRNREIAILTSEGYGGEIVNYNQVKNRKNGNFFDSVDDLTNQYLIDYNNMCDSVDKYGGFFIGRYEITSSGEVPGIPLSSTGNTWYYLYNKCLEFGNNGNTESGMIYGTLWDATMQWLAKSNYWVGNSGQTYSGYGNYNSEAVNVNNNITTIVVKSQGVNQRLETGQTSYTNSNEIYDLAGNCWDWTQEANASYIKVYRGRLLCCVKCK